MQKDGAGIETGQEPTEAESKAGLEEVKAMDLEVNPEETEAVVEQQEIPNEEAILETTGALILGPATGRGILNPRKRRTKDNVVRGTPKGWTFGKR
jgi:hypothetical protein